MFKSVKSLSVNLDEIDPTKCFDNEKKFDFKTFDCM